MTAYALKCALLPNLPQQRGHLPLLEVAAPRAPSSPRFPAPSADAWRRHYLPFAVFGALAPIIRTASGRVGLGRCGA